MPDLRQARLLSDVELKTPPIASASNLVPPTTDEHAWLADNHRSIRSITYDKDFSDLDFLAEVLNGKRIVQLGESSHGTAEFSAIKVRIIKYLHERLGYNVIAFESSVGGCHIQDLDLNLRAPKPKVGVECIFTIWNTADLNELARYIYSTRQTTRPLHVAGFDIQTTSDLDSGPTVAWVSSVLDRVKQDLTNPARDAIVTTGDDEELLTNCIIANKSSCPEFDAQSAVHFQRLDDLSAQLHNLVEATPLDSVDRADVIFAWLSIDALAGRLRSLVAFLE